MSTIDRVNTTWTAIQGLTFGCIQCHAHPYEPIPHEDYFRFSAFFNSTEDADLDSDYPLFKLANKPEERNDAAHCFNTIPQLRQKLNQVGQKWISQDTGFSPLNFSELKTTHGKLKSYPNGELRTSGTLAVQTRFDLKAQPTPFTALRVTIKPETENLRNSQSEARFSHTFSSTN
ncbi:DUF1549 domain-containing protein [Rubritalea tangerina]|uniref:DUF1549 domain-containing protein n=1 Tax=Rubritalea tangerina TaxID=430798 RepID=UPI0036063F40